MQTSNIYIRTRNQLHMLWLLCFTIGLLVSCIDDPGAHSGGSYPVCFTTSLSESNSAPASGRTRASNDSWEADDRVGIYMVEHVDTDADLSAALFANVQYKTSESGTSSELVAVDDAIIYPSNGDEVNFVAYYPYVKTTHTNNNHMYKVDVSSQSNLPAIDLLYHNGVGTAYNRNSTAVGLDFNHQLTKLLIQVIPASDDVDVDLTDATVSLVGFPATADFDLASGVLSNPGAVATDENPIALALDAQQSSERCALFESILVPTEEKTFTRIIRFVIAGESYTYTLPSTAKLQPGCAYSYNFKFTGNRIVLVQNTIVDWDGGTVAWGDYLLTASKIYFDLPFTAGSGHTVTLSTNAPSAPIVSLSEDATGTSADQPTWIIPLLSEGEPGANGWTNYTLTFDTNPNTDASVRTGYIRLEIEGLVLAIRVAQAEGPGVYVNEPDPSSFINVIAVGKTSNKFTIKTNAQNKDITLSNTNSTLINSLKKSRSAVAVDGSSTWTISFDVTANTTFSTRSGNITVTIGGIIKTVNISQERNPDEYNVTTTANCHMIKPGTSGLTFKPFDSISLNGTPLNSTFTVVKLWDDTGAVKSVKIDTGKGTAANITVVPTSTPGNALIAVYHGSKIAWSFHIWVVDYDPDTNYKQGANGFILMDRNLGATRATMGSGEGTGLFYQYGRKDPFPATNTLQTGSFQTMTGPVYQAVAHQNPNKFITASKWININTSKLWKGDAKTPYDPCPSGWEVPNFDYKIGGPFDLLTSSYWIAAENGMSHYQLGLFPACGEREFESGGVKYQGSQAHLWSAINSNFGSGFVYVCRKDDPMRLVALAGNGLNIRCVKER